jgi:hypothetical protein
MPFTVGLRDHGQKNDEAGLAPGECDMPLQNIAEMNGSPMNFLPEI